MYSAILWKEQFLELKKILKTTIVSEASEALKKRGISGQIMMDLPEDLTESSRGNDTEISPEMADFDEIDRIGTAKGKRRKNALSVLVKDGWADKMIYWLEKCNAQMLALKRECEGYCILEEIDLLVHPLLKLHAEMEAYLQEQEEKSVSARDDILDFYFEIRHFLEMYELLDEHYVTYAQICEDGSFFVKLFCVNPRENLKNCMKRGRSSILFSATFLPIQYYKQLLGGDEEDYEVYAQSVFNPEKRALLIANDVTSKYTRRSEDEFFNIALYIDRIVKRRQGNYMVFCPSYAFLNMIYAIYSEAMAGEGVECIIQGEMMSEAQKEEFLARFRESGGGSGGRSESESGGGPFGGPGSLSCSAGEVNERTLVGFCVLGGIFSEGIDLKNDSLIGAIIVGTGLPQVCFEREILKQYFDAQNENGFDYAYRYPGMNKVLQAAGRVIRTSEDLGVIALLDERFLQYAYRRMFPREWENAEVVSLDTVGKRVDRFWNEWL
jgi:Rad3-related DNA helicase